MVLDKGSLSVEPQTRGTKVFCHVACDIGNSSIDRPNEGNVQVHVSFSPMATLAFDVHRLPEVCTQISRTLEKTVRESRLIETESLCIIAGDKVSPLGERQIM